MKTISLVIPFYNEGNTVFEFFKKLLPIIDKLDKYTFELICVDDGSSDDTFDNLYKTKDPRFKIIQFSRNFGKEAALTAGIDLASTLLSQSTPICKIHPNYSKRCCKNGKRVLKLF